MQIIDGQQIANGILARLKEKPAPKKFFAGILIGDDPASASFQAIKEKTARNLGVDYRIYKLDAAMGTDKLRAEVGRIALQKSCGGAIVQLPLPEGVSRHALLNAIPQAKDADVLGERALGAFYTGRNPVIAPAVGAVEEILRAMKIEVKEKKFAVIGSGILIGKPVLNWLMGKAKEIFLLGRASDLALLKHADIVILGTGHAGLVTPDMLQDGAGVIDFGYGTKEMRNEKGEMRKERCGDFDPSSLTNSHHTTFTIHHSPAFYTPPPGGTSPILVTKLFENFYALNSQ